MIQKHCIHEIFFFNFCIFLTCIFVISRISYLLGLVVGLFWKMDTEKKNNQRRHPVYKFPAPALENLLLLANKSPPENVLTFTRDYGRILTWLKAPLTDYQKDGLQALFQFYDRELRCFVFPDYLLMPTLEEYSSILDIPILHQVPFHASMERPTDDQLAKALHLQKFVV